MKYVCATRVKAQERFPAPNIKFFSHCKSMNKHPLSVPEVCDCSQTEIQ